MVSKASLALDALLSEYGSQQALANEIGIQPSVITRWRQGRQAPVTQSRIILSNRLRIPIGDWDLPPAVRSTSELEAS